MQYLQQTLHTTLEHFYKKLVPNISQHHAALHNLNTLYTNYKELYEDSTQLYNTFTNTLHNLTRLYTTLINFYETSQQFTKLYTIIQTHKNTKHNKTFANFTQQQNICTKITILQKYFEKLHTT